LGNNWQFRTHECDFSPVLSKKIYKLNELYNRLTPTVDTPKDSTVMEIVTDKDSNAIDNVASEFSETTPETTEK
jgi:hypothetical protein